MKTHAASVASMSLGYFLIYFFVRDAVVMYAIFVLLSIGWAAVVSLPFAIMTEKVNKHRMGFFMGIFNLSVVLPQLLASFVVGFFIQNAENKGIVYLISAVSLGISALLWTFLKDKKQ